MCEFVVFKLIHYYYFQTYIFIFFKIFYFYLFFLNLKNILIILKDKLGL